MKPDRSDRLRKAIASAGTRAPLDLSPGNAYEALTRAMVEDLGRDLDKIEAQISKLIWTVIGAVIVAVVLQLGGW